MYPSCPVFFGWFCIGVPLRLSRKTGMQKELLHLDLLELTREQSFRPSSWRPKEAPSRASTRRYTTDFEYNIISLQFPELYLFMYKTLSWYHFSLSSRRAGIGGSWLVMFCLIMYYNVYWMRRGVMFEKSFSVTGPILSRGFQRMQLFFPLFVAGTPLWRLRYLLILIWMAGAWTFLQSTNFSSFGVT